jgi:hypothetical protein
MGSAAVASPSPAGHWVGGALLLRQSYFAFFPVVFSGDVRGGSYAG